MIHDLGPLNGLMGSQTYLLPFHRRWTLAAEWSRVQFSGSNEADSLFQSDSNYGQSDPLIGATHTNASCSAQFGRDCGYRQYWINTIDARGPRVVDFQSKCRHFSVLDGFLERQNSRRYF